MKKTFYLLIVFFITITVPAQYHKEYYAIDGRLREEGMLKNGKKQGEWKSYSPHNYLSGITNYEMGIEEGLDTGFHENGKIQSTRTFRKGVLIGEYKAYYDDDKTVEEYINYDTGETKSYHRNGQLEKIGFKIDNEKNGEWKTFYQNGQLSEIGNYQNGIQNGEWKRFYENGQISEIGNYQNGNKMGEWKYFHINGKTNAIGKYENDIGVGTWKTYNDKGENDYCDCPPPTKFDFAKLCNEIYNKKASSDESELSFKYQEVLWKMSCAKDGVDDLETARKKIQCMWNKYRTKIGCNFPGLSVPKGNIVKSSLEINFSFFLISAVKDYKLDMNFKDPVDNRTILDFIRDEIAFVKKSPSDMTMKINEYERLYKLLKDSGAKHGKDL